MPQDLVRIPFTAGQLALFRKAGFAGRIQQDKGKTQVLIPIDLFNRLQPMMAKGETMADTLVSAAQAGMIDFTRSPK